ncbi:MAG: phosphodiester glycosidase family protein [Verrucomicrobiae bacterium]|nr:phosphodiester glycosidase family protein [Verrucomicrobiae bacterium]
MIRGSVAFSPQVLVVFYFFFTGWGGLRADWKIDDQTPAQDPASPLQHVRKLVSSSADQGFFSAKKIDLVWFHGDQHTFRVVDNGPSASPSYSGLADAVSRNGATGGCNGGFFLENHQPSGLMIASGASIGTFGQGGLLSGVVLSSGRQNPYVLRRAEYDAEKFKATDLIQAGPFLVDQGETVKGLSPENSRRRTFVLHDGGKWFALGLSDAFTLAELGAILAREDFSPARKVHRALNLDGGTSSGLYFQRGAAGEPLHMEPFKTVRNFLLIVPKAGS